MSGATGADGWSTGAERTGGRGSAAHPEREPSGARGPRRQHGPTGGYCDGHPWPDPAAPAAAQAQPHGGASRTARRRAAAAAAARTGRTSRRRRTGTAGRARAAGPAGACAGRAPAARTTPRTRKARLRVAKADPWSVMKVSFLLSIALGICTIVAVGGAVDGAWTRWASSRRSAARSARPPARTSANGFDLQSFLSLPRVLMFTVDHRGHRRGPGDGAGDARRLHLQPLRGLRRRRRADARRGRVSARHAREVRIPILGLARVVR